MKVYRINKVSELNNLCNSEQNKNNDVCYIVKHDSLAIGTGKYPNSYSKDKIAKYGIGDNDVFNGEYFGGTIVCFPNDLSIVWITKEDNDAALHCLEEVCKYLNSKNLIVRRSGNDLLLYDNTNAYKVASCAKGTLNSGIVINSLHISIGIDLDIIKDICNKPMLKIPKGLAEYNINADEIIQEIIPL